MSLHKPRSRRVSWPVVYHLQTPEILESGLALRRMPSSTFHQGKQVGGDGLFIRSRFVSSRPLDMDIHLQSFTIPHYPSLMIAMSKPAYLAIVEYAPTKPVIVFVSSRRQCRQTVDDLLLHCTADNNPDRFLNIGEADLQPHLDHISDKSLVECLKHGIGYYHEALDKQDKVIVERLFESGAIQVLVASKVCFFSLAILN